MNVVVGAAIDEERISAEAHLLGEVVGLALREMPACPVQINLMPPDLVALKTFRRRLPYFGAAAAGLILSLAVVWMLNSMTTGVREKQLTDVSKRLEEIRATQSRLDQTRARNQGVKTKANDLSRLIASRTTWLDVIRGVRDSLLPGMWVRQIDIPRSAVDDVASFELTVAGFEDQLREFDSEQKTAAEVFRDRLNSDSRFSDKTEITRQPLPKPHLRELTLNVVLAASSADAGVPGDPNRRAGQ